MDEYKEVLQRLSCVSLRRIDEMTHDTVFRSAFIVESVQVRIANKTQKKFAILVISDGFERQELPIWSDLYEEKSHLLKENQLLYAILQVDKRKEELKLSCRWLEDLTRANEAIIEACDRAFDKAKYQATRFSAKNGHKPLQEKTKMPIHSIPNKLLLIKLDADETRLSHILQLKRVFAQHQGEIPVQIQFQVNQHSLAILHVMKGGIIFSEQVKQKLGEIGSILSVEMMIS
jgi:DNA polymerase-3 subunit alpha